MGLITKFASRKLLVVLGTIAMALLPMLVEKITEAIDWRIFVLAGGYIIANVIQKVCIAYIQKDRRAH